MLRFLGKVFFLLVLLGGLTVSAYAAGGVAEGDLGQDVSAIQERLVALGYSLPSVDGDFGPATKQAVVLFQKDRGLPTDGVVGADTYRAILGREMPVSRDGGSTATVRRIIQTAMRYMGVPYVFGGNTPSGFDCSGFVKFVYARCGMDLPRMADEQFEVGVPVPANLLQAGDMVFFSTYDDGASHAGIYVGDGKFISATSSRGVAVDTLDDGYWGPRYIGARRLQ